MHRYRVFISYAHADRELVERLDGILAAAGLDPLWDRDLQPGEAFSKQIQQFITNSHVLLPLITPHSIDRPWVHHEIGFAIARGTPVLPVTQGVDPVGMIRELHAIPLADAPQRLSAECLRRLTEGDQVPAATYECTPDNTQRAQLLARYADSVSALDRYDLVRQQASLTTFHLPDRGSGDRVWNKYFSGTPNELSLFEALRHERVALQKHAIRCGCQLILDPFERLATVHRRHGPGSVRARVEGLLSFLRDDSVRDVVVAINDDAERTSSFTFVGDWFSSEAVSTGVTRVLREALFTRHGPTIRQQIQDFDTRMRGFLTAKGWDAASSRASAIDYLQGHLDKSDS